MLCPDKSLSSTGKIICSREINWTLFSFYSKENVAMEETDMEFHNFDHTHDISLYGTPISCVTCLCYIDNISMKMQTSNYHISWTESLKMRLLVIDTFYTFLWRIPYEKLKKMLLYRKLTRNFIVFTTPLDSCLMEGWFETPHWKRQTYKFTNYMRY